MQAAAEHPHVIVADDDRDVADGTAAVLRGAGCMVEVAYDGQAALEAIRMRRPQVAVLDLDMPGLDGCSLARLLRAHPDTARMRLIALTGRHLPADRAATSDAGFDLHLLKPITAGALCAAVLGHADDA